jgi:hypothetical protein
LPDSYVYNYNAYQYLLYHDYNSMGSNYDYNYTVNPISSKQPVLDR